MVNIQKNRKFLESGKNITFGGDFGKRHGMEQKI